MRINPKIYHIADEAEYVDRQELENERVVEIYIMDQFSEVYDEFTGQSKFYVWSSEDGYNYRLYVESEYYDKLRDLYQASVNKVWIDFWDECEKVTGFYQKKVIMPVTLLFVIIYFIFMSLYKGDGENLICVLLLGTFVIALVFLTRLSKRKIAMVNVDSIAKIKEAIGEDKFRELLEAQRNYPDEFYERKYPSTSLDEEEEEKSGE